LKFSFNSLVSFFVSPLINIVATQFFVSKIKFHVFGEIQRLSAVLIIAGGLS